MKTQEGSMKTLQMMIIGALLLGTAVARAEDLASTAGYSRKGEISPNADAPSQDAMVAAIRNGSPEALKATLEYGERVVCTACVPLLEGKLVESDNARVRELSAWWLRRQAFAGPAAVVRLRKQIVTETNETRRARLAEALGEFMDPHALPELADRALQDQSVKVRVASVRALTRLNSDAAGAVLADVLSDKSFDVKLAALEGLLTVRYFSDYAALLPLLGDADATVRQRTARLCGEKLVRAAEPVLIAMLRGDESVQVRQAAAWALGRVGGGDGRAALAAANKDEKSERVLDAIDIAERMPARF